jgi:hypothetical protein
MDPSGVTSRCDFVRDGEVKHHPGGFARFSQGSLRRSGHYYILEYAR